MTAYLRIKCVKVQPSDNDNRITLNWIDPFGDLQSYTINQRILNRYNTPEELKADLDQFTQNNWGYVISDIWFHLNRDGTWAIATGINPPATWPEDEELP